MTSEWLRALLEFEIALARAQAAAGVISAADAERIAAACDPACLELRETAVGNPAGAVVEALRAVTDAPVHHGATSQDAMDTAAMLVAKRALVPLLADLKGAADAAARLARTHRATPIIGRTLLQHAVPTTFGLKAAGWMTALDEAAAGLRRVPLRAQLGGPAGTLAPLPGFAAELGLEEPTIPWHTLRGPLGELAGALAVAAGACGKAALDVILLAQTEVAEVQEERPGGSTAMPHKRNPIAAVEALGHAKQAPGLAATLLAAIPQEHERAAGAWHSEWRPLSELLDTTRAAASHTRVSLEGLTVDAARMRANLGETDPDTGAAALLVDRALEAR